jgi:hypothetical protein
LSPQISPSGLEAESYLRLASIGTQGEVRMFPQS